MIRPPKMNSNAYQMLSNLPSTVTRAGWGILYWWALSTAVHFGPTAIAADIRFSRDVLPILSDTCFTCHGPDAKARMAGLRLDREEGAFGTGESGAKVIVPGDESQSELIRRITTTDPDEVMPPPESLRQLSSQQVAVLRDWIQSGAKWGKHWAYEIPTPPQLPMVQAPSDQVRNPIDAFVVARLRAMGLEPASRAAKETLLRRVTLDLTGLPPSLDEMDSFLADTSPNAYETVVDRLLASSRYGERWAFDWLDAARYADTNGFQGDPERTMWPWRDWVVQAINQNMPYDQFTVEQLAGDLLPDATRDQRLASGFHRNNMHNGEGGRIAEETRVENVFDRVESTATVWLGSTFTCCRCHDHKYDPFTLQDYFGFYDIFNQMSESGSGGGGQMAPVLDYSTPEEEERLTASQRGVDESSRDVEAFELKKFPRAEGAPLTESAAATLPGNLPAYIARTAPVNRGVSQLVEAIHYFEADGNDPEYVKVLQTLLDRVRVRDDARSSISKVLIMDQVSVPRDTFVLIKGSYDKPTTTKVMGALPASLVSSRDSKSIASDGRLNRLDLARWLVSAENPLTARVTVNRFWQSFFGVGLVKTTEDFGLQGEKPSFPELLDWLATDFVQKGWNVKSLHKTIVMSETYQQSSEISHSQFESDPENRYLARGPRYRLPSWMLRDIALSVSGLLVDRLGGPAVKPYQPPGVWEEATFGFKSYQQDHGNALYRRSLYIYWRRIVSPTVFFDNATRQTCSVMPFRTNTPLHALSTLNDVTYVEAARNLAQRVMLGAFDDHQRIALAFRLVTGRRPNEKEGEIMMNRLSTLKNQYRTNSEDSKRLLLVGESPSDASLDAADHAAFTGLCQLILNLDEALSKE